MNSHRADIKHRRTEKPVAAHFTSPNHTIDDLQVLVIETIKKEDTILRKIKEARWISILETAWPLGMNLRTDSL